jgi:polysaccharide export outer membrane protein
VADRFSGTWREVFKMNRFGRQRIWTLMAAMLGLALIGGGCSSVNSNAKKMPEVPFPNETPRELRKVSLPTYTIEPPDILLIDVVNAVPKAPYRIREQDMLRVEVTGVLPQRPITGNYAVESGGMVNLGEPYGYVQVGKMTLQEANQAINEHLKTLVRNPEASVTLVQYAARQQITGEHMVGPDGNITLGAYGDVYIVGMTREQAKATVEQHLAQFFESPEVSVDIFAYNSKVYYVIVAGAGHGDGIARYPVTGNETVLDAISQIQGLQPYSSKRIWIARPSPAGNECAQVLPVDWEGITQRADTLTNHQLMPGDRLFVEEDKWYTANSWVNKVVSPFERAFGFILLGTGMSSRLAFFYKGQINGY